MPKNIVITSTSSSDKRKELREDAHLAHKLNANLRT